MNYFQNKGKDAHVAALGGFFFLEHLSIDPEHGSTRDVSPSPCVELSKFLLYIFTKQNLLYIIS